MSNSDRNLNYWLGAWLPVVACICIIAMESTEAFGSDKTSGPLRIVFQAIFGRVSNAAWAQIHLLIRKSGHFFGYGLLGMAWLRAWWMTLPKSVFLTDAMLALLGTGIIAGTDEYHQAFLPNRTASPWDVLIDCCGAITLQCIVYVFMRIFKPKRLVRAA